MKGGYIISIDRNCYSKKAVTIAKRKDVFKQRIYKKEQ